MSKPILGIDVSKRELVSALLLEMIVLYTGENLATTYRDLKRY